MNNTMTNQEIEKVIYNTVKEDDIRVPNMMHRLAIGYMVPDETKIKIGHGWISEFEEFVNGCDTIKIENNVIKIK